MSESDKADVVALDKVGDLVRDKVKRKKQDARAEALASQFHRAMGWKGPVDTATKSGKSKRKKKRS